MGKLAKPKSGPTSFICHRRREWNGPGSLSLAGKKTPVKEGERGGGGELSLRLNKIAETLKYKWIGYRGYPYVSKLLFSHPTVGLQPKIPELLT